MLCEKGWEKGIKVCSAAVANAISVAEHTLGLMISTLKRVYWFNNAMRENSGELIAAEKEKARALYI